ncbi:hypothetical protein IMSAGC008_00186 [Muribaculaceae bacterium]|nr:hypothetical protein IMSAGC008_00186 [Muribaculaceae bacterium]
MSTNCASVDIYDSLEHCKGETVLPGLRPGIWYIPKSSIHTFPKLPDIYVKDATMESIGTYEGDFGLAADTVFRSVDIVTSASSVKTTSQGEKPSKTFINSATFKYAGNNAKAAGFCRMANSDDLLYIYRQRDGSFRVLGNEAFETETNPSQDSGMAVTDASGTTLEISVTDTCPAPFYVGKLKTAEGIIDCSTGDITVPESGV